jgi:antitoxin component of MazEF toxin-antitoxin module
MVEIIFKDNHIQKGYRVKIPKAIVDTLELDEGQKIKIRFDVNKKVLIIEEDKNDE